MKSSKFYVIEYRYWDKLTESWISHISQEGYSNYEDAKAFCLKRAFNAGSTDKPMYFQNITVNSLHEEFHIHEVLIT